jgi:hypothetical protein
MKRTAAHTLRSAAVVAAVVLGGVGSAGTAAADDLGYLVNVTVRPYHFADATAALDYGRHICASIGSGKPYAEVASDAMTDQATTDEYQASYLITQAAEELCPALIPQLRSSAAGYRPSP